MKIAHIITAYKDPHQLETLVIGLRHPQSDIYIHLDKKIDIHDFQYLTTLYKVRFIENRIRCNWGGFSFVKAIISSLKEILDNDNNYEYLNLLSGQDYLLKSPTAFYEFLKANRGRSFVSFEELGKSVWWEHAVTRYEFYHLTDFNFRGRYLIQRLINKITPKRCFPLKIKLYGSAKSSWWTMNIDCVKYILDFIENNPKLMNFMRYTWAADEFLFPTIIMNSPLREKIVNNNLRYIEWEDGSANPRILKQSDFSILIESGNFFARKFDVKVDSKILTQLEEVLFMPHNSVS